MLKLLTMLQKKLVWAIPAVMLGGLIFGYLKDATALKVLFLPATFVMVYPVMVTLDAKKIFREQDAKLLAAAQAVNFVVIPLLAYATGRIFFSGETETFSLWAVGLFLVGMLPTSGMTVSWTRFAGGNRSAAVKMVAFGLVLGALLAPIYTKAFMSAVIDVDMGHMFRQTGLFVFLPLAAGLLTQRLLQRRYGMDVWDRRIKPRFPPFSALGVVMIAFLATSLKARHIIANPGDILTILVPLLVFYAASYLFVSIIGRLLFNREDAIALVFGVVMRNLSIALAVAMTAFGEQGITIALLIALAYVVQIQSAAWYVRFAGRIFGTGKKYPNPVPEEIPSPAQEVRVIPMDAEMPAEPGLPPAIQKILYATDLTPAARHAARYACALGHRFGAEVHVIHVIQDALDAMSTEAGISFADMVEHADWEAFQEEGLEKAKQAISRRIQEASRDVKKEMPLCPLSRERVFVEVGDPVQTVLSVAERGGFDLIVLGTHGHGRLKNAVLGSVAADIVKMSKIPVMVVRLPEETSRLRPMKDEDRHLAPLAGTGI